MGRHLRVGHETTAHEWWEIERDECASRCSCKARSSIVSYTIALKHYIVDVLLRIMVSYMQFIVGIIIMTSER